MWQISRKILQYIAHVLIHKSGKYRDVFCVVVSSTTRYSYRNFLILHESSCALMNTTVVVVTVTPSSMLRGHARRKRDATGARGFGGAQISCGRAEGRDISFIYFCFISWLTTANLREISSPPCLCSRIYRGKQVNLLPPYRETGHGRSVTLRLTEIA